MSDIYKNPKYYDIAFSWRDIPLETDVFEESMRRYSRIPVRHVFEPACGNSPHMGEFIKRGYKYTGIDKSRAMLDYARKKTGPGFCAELICADISGFAIKNKADFAYIMLGSLYIKSEEELVSHFDSVSGALKKGGLYFLDWCVQFDCPDGKIQSWKKRSGNCRVKATYSCEIINKISQTIGETLRLDVTEGVKQKTFVNHSVKKAIYPQEFLNFMAGRRDFEFIGWWNNWNLEEPLTGSEKIVRPIIIIRKI
ncbi:MAG TPA: hypothetical protein DCL44_06860 [Elusimicrobia bacterium]|nr:hypothetical protein [Elusimicrobiota bacterium]